MQKMNYSNYSTVIIGSGIAGLYASLKLAESGAKILLVTKSRLGESNSRYAQGGMVGVMKENKADSVESHICDTIKAGAGLSEFDAVKYISEKSDAVVKDLLKLGVEFDKDESGNFTYTLEGAHSVNRVLHAGGDATGRMIEQALCAKIKANPNVEVYEKTMAVELLTNDDCGVNGVVVFLEETQEYEAISTSAVILATGGLGQLYKYTTNPAGATADGITLAYHAGATLQDMEFVQFHPTALALDEESENRFLISEAVRGEGAKLVDADGHEFMHKYHEMAELAPRDVVTRAIFNEMGVNKLENVYLNATGIDAKKLAKRFPNISKKCLEHGIDISKDFIPVAPAAHYFMGGIKTDLEGKTSVEGLFAIGETASTGLHGGNRLASNSLLECVVCANAVAEHIKLGIRDKKLEAGDIKFEEQFTIHGSQLTSKKTAQFREQLQTIMWENVGILRSKSSLFDALEQLAQLPLIEGSSRESYELRNMIDAAKLVTICAINREESRGAHFRTDYTQTNEERKHSEICKSTTPNLQMVGTTTVNSPNIKDLPC